MARKQRHEEEEHENHERWLVTYADMLTLLMVLFVVMFAMSNVDAKKFNALKSGLAAGFGQSTSVLDGSTSILDEPGTAAIAPINPNKVEQPEEIEEIKSTAATQALAKQQQRAYAEAAGEVERLAGIEKRLQSALKKHGLSSDVLTTIDGRGLTVSLVSRHIVFESNLATLTARGREIVDTLSPVLADLDDNLAIEGHTNQAKGTPKYYASDWDLSTARAITVLRRLHEQRGVPESRLSAVGFGHVKPRIDPSKPGSQQVNKRVDIVVLSRLVDDSSELVDQVVHDRATGATPTGTTTNTTETSHTTERGAH
jgi:chemotaxis protein MotB